MKNKILIVFLCSLMLLFTNSVLYAAGPTGPVGAPGSSVTEDSTEPGVNINDTVNNNTNINNNANTNININNSNVNNSNVGSNNKINQTNTVNNITKKTMEVKKYVNIKIGGQPLKSDVQPFINGDNRTVLPIRAIAEAFGAKVDWDQSTQIATITYGDKVVKIKIGDKTFEVNGQVFTMDTTAFSKDGRTFLPARAIAEALGLKVGWDQATSTVTIDAGSNNSQTPAGNSNPGTPAGSTNTNDSAGNTNTGSTDSSRTQLAPGQDENLKVSGFPVKDFKGTVNGDGSFQGSGQLALPEGNLVNATFSVDSQGKILSGSWNGNLKLYGWQFNIPAGKIDDAGVNGITSFKLANSQTQLRIAINSSGSLTSNFTGSFQVGGWSLTDASLNLNNNKMTGNGSVSILGSNVNFSLNVDSSGAVSGGTRTTLKSNLPGGKVISIPDVALSLSSNGVISGTGTIKAGNTTITQATVNVQPNGTVSGSGSVSVGVGKITSNYSLGPSGFTVNGTASLAPIRIPVMVPNPLGIPPMVSVDLTLSGSVSLSVKNMNEIVATATGTVEGPWGTKQTVSHSINLVTGEITVEILGVKVNFKLF